MLRINVSCREETRPHFPRATSFNQKEARVCFPVCPRAQEGLGHRQATWGYCVWGA